MYNSTLRTIYNNLMNGEQYGYLPTFRNDYPERDLAGKQYFSIVLYKHSFKPYFCWTHFGSSANQATLKDLLWLITVIFNCTPDEFVKRYITRSEARKNGIALA